MASKHALLHLKTQTLWLVKKSSFDGTTNSSTPGLMAYNASYEQVPLVNPLSSGLPPLVLCQNVLHVNMARPSNVRLKQNTNMLILPT